MTYSPCELIRMIDGSGYLSSMIGIVIARYNEKHVFVAISRAIGQHCLTEYEKFMHADNIAYTILFKDANGKTQVITTTIPSVWFRKL